MTTAPRSGDVSHVRALLLVFAGGVLGTGTREALALAFPAPAGSFPVTIFAINVVGAFLLGTLLEALAGDGSVRAGADTENRRRRLRLLLGTGVLGGFTTYSAFAADTAVLLGTAPTVAFLYAGGSLIMGLLASGIGIALVGAIRRSRQPGSAS